MGRRSGGSNKSRSGTKKQNAETNKSHVTDSSNVEDELDSLLFKPMPPNKRNELNSIVEKLLNITSNYVSDEPTSTTKLRQEFGEIFDLVKRIITQEQQFNMSRKLRASRKPYLQSLVEWLEIHGATLDGVEPADYGSESGFGLRATKDLKKGDRIICIPRRCFMSTETAKDSTISSLMEKDPMLRSMPNVALALHLLIEKNSPASFWEPYINVLPSSYSTVLYFSPSDFDQLKGSPAYEDALRQFKYVARQYAYFYRKFQSTMLRDYFTFEDYRWAVSTVMTRQNQVPCKDDFSKTTNTLIPFWDLANHECHSGSEISTDFDDANNITICMANRDFEKGEQYTIYYGKRSNADLLVHNGFVYSRPSIEINAGNEESCHHDFMVLRLGIGRNDPLAKPKYDLLDQLSIPRSGGQFIINMEEKPFDNVLLAFLRILCMNTKEELEKWTNPASQSTVSERSEQIDVNKSSEKDSLVKEPNFADKVRDLLNNDLLEYKELDAKVHKYLETRCTLLLRNYPTSLEEDLKQLKLNGDGEREEATDLKQMHSLNERNCMILRFKEKQILQHVIKFCQTR